MDIVFFFAGLALLVVGAEVLVKGASSLALSLGLSPLVVGLTVVAFGTSAPEMAVSVGAVRDGQTNIAVGNVLGSNIFNVFVILGVSALITPLIVNRQLIRQEVPFMIAISALVLVLLRDLTIGPFEAALLLVLLLGYTAVIVVQSRRANGNAGKQDGTTADTTLGPLMQNRLVQGGLILGGLGGLVLGSRLLVTAASNFALALGVSDLVVGLTIVAAGTSLPEVATSIAAALRGDRDIAVGNVVGSNIFNLLGCLGLAGLASGGVGITVPPSVMAFDAWVMIAATVACLPIFLTGHVIARWEGGVFLAYYVFYAGYLVLAAEQHDALETYTAVMTFFVIPLTLVTAAAVYLSSRVGDR